ncbi:hypothetical protein EJB05_46067, partial [Eragrostis curvula]
MGKRKSRTSKLLAQPRKVAKLDTVFSCPFCNHAGSVECSIDRKHGIAKTSCFICKEFYATTAHALTEPVDVYSDWIDTCVKWIDACEKANEGIRRRVSSYADDEGSYLQAVPFVA